MSRHLTQLLGGIDPPGDSPDDRLPPLPTLVLVARITAGQQTVTSITRRWREGDPERCRLCPSGQCAAALETCLIVAPRDVPDGEAALFRRGS